MKITDFLNAQFSKYIRKSSVFKDRSYLSESYIPDNLQFREDEIKEMSTALLPLLKNQKASNVLLLGPPGTGKTASAKFFLKVLQNFAAVNSLKISTVYINCRFNKLYKSEYNILKEIIQQISKTPIKAGAKLSDLHTMFVDILKKTKHSILVVLDEIDLIVKHLDDDFIYMLTRGNHISDKDNLAFIGIANNLTFLDELDPRSFSSLGAVKILFKPYSAKQLSYILKERAKKAFVKDAISEEVINYIAAWIAKESGDARKAINILRLSGEIADREESPKVTIEYVKEAIDRYDIDSFLSMLDSLVLHDKLLLFSIIEECLKNDGITNFSDVYNTYFYYSKEFGFHPLSKDNLRRKLKLFKILFSDYIDIKNISLGRHGRKILIELFIDPQKLRRAKEKLYKELTE